MYSLIQYHPSWEQLHYKRMGKDIKMIEEHVGITGLPIKELEIQKEKQQIRYIEEPFEIKLRRSIQEIKNDLGEEVVLIYIGQVNKMLNHYIAYELVTHRFRAYNKENSIIITDIEDEHMTSSQYLRCIIDVVHKAVQMNKRPIIYCDIHISNESIRYRSLNSKIINHLLEKVNGILICKCCQNVQKYYQSTERAFEPYIDYTVYTQDSIQKAIFKIKKYQLQNTPIQLFKRVYYSLEVRESGRELYEDVFYQQINEDMMIYVPILSNSIVPREVYEGWGFEYIAIERDYGILYGKKKIFDQKRKELIRNVLPRFTPQIMTYAYPIIKKVYEGFEFEPRKKQRYNGEGVYIGIIGVEGIDYTHPSVVTKQNNSRIAYVWEQIEGAKGKSYVAKDIESALGSGAQLSIASQNFNSMETLVLGMAGGKGDTPEGEYRGLATEAEFIVAKIKKAPNELQSIYGGEVNEQATLLEDVLIGVNNLVEYANFKGKPLVLCIPFGTNISSHDGTMTLQNRLEAFAGQPGVSIVIPTGEEADKYHHVQVNLQDEKEYEVEIEQPLNKIVGLIFIAPRLNVKIKLKNLTTNKAYDLNEAGNYREEEMVILSEGVHFNYNNGQRQNVFSMENVDEGRWILSFQAVDLQETNSNYIFIWISQQELNPSAKLNPASVFTTIPSLGNMEDIICVGNYDNTTSTTYKSSGRGYTTQNLVRPNFSAQGKEVPYLNRDNQWELVTGGVAVIANIAGVAAAVYSKALEQGIERLPNSPIMNSLFIDEAVQLDTVQYPNQSQGFGIFNRTSLDTILDPSRMLKI